MHKQKLRAGDENRTRMTCLEGRCTTIVLLPLTALFVRHIRASALSTFSPLFVGRGAGICFHLSPASAGSGSSTLTSRSLAPIALRTSLRFSIPSRKPSSWLALDTLRVRPEGIEPPLTASKAAALSVKLRAQSRKL